MLRLTSKDSASDAELLARYRENRSLEVLTQLFGRYTALVYGVCLKYLKDREEARDMVMLVFEKLIEVLPHQSIDNFKPWLYVTTRNQCLMQLRKRRGSGPENLDDSVMENTLMLHPDAEPDMELNLTKLESCVERLIEDQKKCVRLFFLEEHSYLQVAEKTGYTMNQVKSYIQNGKRNLKICMEENGG